MTHDGVKGRYRHYKGGVYAVLGEALHSETHEKMIVYVDAGDETRMWVRPKAMFFESVTVEGRSKPRFERIWE